MASVPSVLGPLESGDLGFTLMLLGIKNFMRQTTTVEHPTEVFTFLNIVGSD